jgi:hypothetical protein
MTRKQALSRAIAILSQDRENAEVVQKLAELRDDLPLVHWTDGSIRDTVEQFIHDHGRVPRAADFKKKGLPPHPVVKQKYKITVGEWLEQNYPVVKPTFEEIKAKRTKAFLEDYYRIKPRSSEEFNRERTPGTFGWMSVARYYHTRSWRTFLKMLDLPLYFDMQKDHIPIKVTVNFHLDYDFTD